MGCWSVIRNAATTSSEMWKLLPQAQKDRIVKFVTRKVADVVCSFTLQTAAQEVVFSLQQMSTCSPQESLYECMENSASKALVNVDELGELQVITVLLKIFDMKSATARLLSVGTFDAVIGGNLTSLMKSYDQVDLLSVDFSQKVCPKLTQGLGLSAEPLTTRTTRLPVAARFSEVLISGWIGALVGAVLGPVIFLSSRCLRVRIRSPLEEPLLQVV